MHTGESKTEKAAGVGEASAKGLSGCLLFNWGLSLDAWKTGTFRRDFNAGNSIDFAAFSEPQARR